MNQYAVLINLESKTADRYTLSSLALHVTILGIFSTKQNAQFFTAVLAEQAESQTSIKTVATSRALFGINRDIPVTVVEQTEPLLQLHTNLINSVRDVAEFRAPQFIGSAFGPHVTDQGNRRVEVGSKVILDNLTLVEILDQDVLVRSIHTLT